MGSIISINHPNLLVNDWEEKDRQWPWNPNFPVWKTHFWIIFKLVILLDLSDSELVLKDRKNDNKMWVYIAPCSNLLEPIVSLFCSFLYSSHEKELGGAHNMVIGEYVWYYDCMHLSSLLTKTHNEYMTQILKFKKSKFRRAY